MDSRIPEQQPEKKKGKKKKVIRIIVLVLVGILLLLLLGAFLVFNRYYGMMNITSRDDQTTAPGESAIWWETDPPAEGDDTAATDSPSGDITSADAAISSNQAGGKEPIEDKDVLNVLFIGVDAYQDKLSGRSDVCMVMSLNRRTRQVVMTSILRDCYVYIPGKGNNRINAAYAFGRADLLIRTIEANFDLRIDRFAIVNFTGFENVVNTIGGLNITVDASEHDIIQRFIPNISPVSSSGGKYRYCMNGNQALRYVRLRKGAGSDFSRTMRQQAAIRALMDQAKDMSVSELNAMLEAVLPLITTDLTRTDLLSLIANAAAYLSYERVSVQIPVKDGYSNIRINGAAVLSLDFEKNKSALYKAIYGIDY